eukprot:TRINITY_DN1076_c0_g1_i1.p1 TRINITY_DN1076_c0_g1~~TRINITY_DN1076_c0_g1_i1.p1  ORF type:complete len:289 (-),score=63.91 TRINITY_DN1076_c0_g1_i1:150-1016(-)
MDGNFNGSFQIECPAFSRAGSTQTQQSRFCIICSSSNTMESGLVKLELSVNEALRYRNALKKELQDLPSFQDEGFPSTHARRGRASAAADPQDVPVVLDSSIISDIIINAASAEEIESKIKQEIARIQSLDERRRALQADADFLKNAIFASNAQRGLDTHLSKMSRLGKDFDMLKRQAKTLPKSHMVAMKDGIGQELMTAYRKWKAEQKAEVPKRLYELPAYVADAVTLVDEKELEDRKQALRRKINEMEARKTRENNTHTLTVTLSRYACEALCLDPEGAKEAPKEQ